MMNIKNTPKLFKSHFSTQISFLEIEQKSSGRQKVRKFHSNKILTLSLLDGKSRKNLSVARAETDAEAVALAETNQVDGITIFDESSGLSILK